MTGIEHMRFCILGSGSAGNCALLQTPRARVLIDAGFSARKTSELLASVGEALDRIDAIFITHEHGDHAAALSGLSKHPKIKVFANAPTARAVQSRLKHKLGWKLFETGTRFEFLDLEVESFSVPHDAQEPVGFMFSHKAEAGQMKMAPTFSTRTVHVSSTTVRGSTSGEMELALDFGESTPEVAGIQDKPLSVAANLRSIAWLTDLGYVPQYVHDRIRHAEVLVVEANHCAELLKSDTKRPWSVKQRIGGRHGHLSNQAARALLESIEMPSWKHIYLTHLSRDCNSPEAVQQAFTGIDAVLKCAFSVVPPGMSTAFYEFD